jgi:hypothetical protein
MAKRRVPFAAAGQLSDAGNVELTMSTFKTLS